METVAVQVVEHVHDAIITIAADGTVTLWNSGAERLYGYTAAEAKGRQIDFLGLPSDRSAYGDVLPPPGSQEVISVIRRHRHRSGDEVLVNLRVARLHGPSLHQLLLCATDIGDQQRVENDLAASRFAVERGRQEIRRLAGRLLEAQEEDRRRLARELHDDIGQRLATLIVDASVLRRDHLSAPDGNHGTLPGASMADRLVRQLQDLSRDVRYLSHQLHPAALDRMGLATALEAHVNELQESTDLEVRFTVRGAADPLPTGVALGLFRIAQEALHNVVRHAETCQTHLSLVEEGDEIRMAVADAGVGFDPDAVGATSLGLASMEERARLLGGHLRLSSAPGAGTEVEAVLRLADDTADAETTSSAEMLPDAERPRLIGPYRLLEVLGKGASATVYLAEEPPPLGRRVALKLHRAPLAGHRETLRFKAERQALARLRHPNVAQVYEARTTENGDPYIVMEYVPGIAITAYSDRYRLNLRRRLELFLGVCEGVQHAHQKGVLHRDLKPDNVLVREDDGQAQPKLIDFGVAKGIDQPLAEGTVWIEDAGAAGTLGYASPEALAGDDIDTRSDVWSLGVMLHELLIGVLPGEEPAWQGRRFLALPAAEKAMLAAARDTSPGALARSLRDDLKWITMKALTPEPAARYTSAAALAEDIGRHLRDEPVEAGPSSLGYHLGRFVHRHRSDIRSTALVLFSLAGGFYTTLRKSRKAARDAAIAERVTEFLVELFETPGPGARGEDMHLSQILHRSVGRVAAELSGQPRARAELLHNLGVTYSMLGLHDDARSLLEEALAVRREIHGDEHREVAECLVGLGDVHFRSDEVDSIPFYREALATRQKLFGTAHPEIVEPLHSLGVIHACRKQPEEARRLLERALAIQEEALGPTHLEVAKTLHNLASPAFFQKRFDDAEALMRRALAIREGALPAIHPHLAGNHLALAFLFQTQKRWADAEASVEQALAILEKIREVEHPEVTLAHLLRDQVTRAQSDPALAEEMFLRAPAIRERALAPDHPRIVDHILHLADLLRDQRREREAEPLYRRVLEMCRQRERRGAEETGHLMRAGSDYAELLRRTDRVDEATALVKRIAPEASSEHAFAR